MSDHEDDPQAGDPLGAEVHVPEHVIFRSFANETVALNLQTGKFHGLNPTAGRMVEVVSRARCPRDVVSQLASEFSVSEERIAADLSALLSMLLARRLIERDG